VIPFSCAASSASAICLAWQQWSIDLPNRSIPGPIYRERIDGIVAFMGSGMQGPMYAGFKSGFQPGSFYDIDRPLLVITGKGDESGEPSESRTSSWLTSEPGSKYLSWDIEIEAEHETMNVNTCGSPLQSNHCRWITSLGIAYVDAFVRQRPEAIAWLASDSYSTLTGGAIELHRR
jgi:hypothetical protein